MNRQAYDLPVPHRRSVAGTLARTEGADMEIFELLKWWWILRALGYIQDDDPPAIVLDFIGDAIPGTINGL